MAQVGALLQGIASLIWALVGLGLLIFAFINRQHLTALAKRLRRAKILGQEFELEGSQEKGEPRVIDAETVPLASNPRLPALPSAENPPAEGSGK